VAWQLFEKAHGRRKVRLLGVSLSGLVAPQAPLFAPKTSPADAVRDVVRERFGAGALTRASQLAPRGRARQPRK